MTRRFWLSLLSALPFARKKPVPDDKARSQAWQQTLHRAFNRHDRAENNSVDYYYGISEYLKSPPKVP